MRPPPHTDADHIRAATGYRRYVTVLFSDVSDSSEHAERLEAEEYAELLEKFRRFAREVIPRHGGSVARLQGDGVLALFGHLAPGEDDARHATDAALELHDAVAHLRAGSGAAAVALKMHSGIHAGLVLVIDGDIERGRFDVVGEVPNTAARLCSLAAAGEVLVSAEALGPQAHFFKVAPLQRLAIKGRSAPLDVQRVLGRAAVERRIDAAARRGVVAFAGREPAMRLLLAGAERTAQGMPTAIVVSGEPGIGKTRLIDEFRRRLDTSVFQVMQGCCESYLGAEPLQPFAQALRGALRPPQVHAGTTTEDRPPVVLRAASVVERIAQLARQRPMVLILDDWQWADDASREVLESLWALQLPILALLATRPGAADEVTLADAQTLRLQALDPADAEGAIAAWLPNADPFVAQEIYRKSGGSPLFIEELCHAAAAGGDMRTAPRGSGVAWINTLVASRLARLPEPQAECLRLASVAGTAFPVWLIERLIGTHDATQLLEALAAQDFLVSAEQPGMLRFKHTLTREAVYATVEVGQRRALHWRVAESLQAAVGERDAFDWLETLAYHCDAAGASEPAALFAEAAGDKALAALALDRARSQYTTALRALDAAAVLSPPMQSRWCAIAEKLGQACVFDPLDTSHGLKLFERAVLIAQATGDVNALARAEYWLAYVNYGKGRLRDAVRHARAALDHALACDEPRLVAQVRATLGEALASAGHYVEAMPLLEQAVHSKRAQSRPGNNAAIGSAYAMARRAYTLGDLGRFEEAHAGFDEAMALLGDRLHPVGASVRELRCAVHLWQGRWEDAHSAGLEGAAIALRCRSRYLTAMGRALGACGAWALRGEPGSLQELREATHWIESRGGGVSTSLNYGWLVEAAVACGRLEEARRHAARLFHRARAHDRHGEAMGCRALARLAAARGEPQRASRYLDAADRAARFRGSPRELAVNRLARAELAAGAGRLAEARALAAQASEAFDSMRMAWHLDAAARLASPL